MIRFPSLSWLSLVFILNPLFPGDLELVLATQPVAVVENPVGVLPADLNERDFEEAFSVFPNEAHATDTGEYQALTPKLSGILNAWERPLD